MHVFIDTNIFLDFYRLSSGDLEELRKIAKLTENNKIILYLSDYLVDEYSRNRESAIAQAVSQFKKSKFELHLPNLVRVYDESEDLLVTRKQFQEQVKALEMRLNKDIVEGALQADAIIEEVFWSKKIDNISSEIIREGILRSELSKPPGKKGSVGDSIHWEWLLSIVPNDTDFYIISGDGDFESEVLKGNIKSYLLDEWSDKKGSEIYLYQNLTSYLQEHFPDIKLADEIDKKTAIEKLQASRTFGMTHNAISRLNNIYDYSAEEIQQLLNAYITNTQIHWILEDDDVRQFAMNLVQFAYDNGLENEAYPLEEMLNELELDQT